MIWEPPGRPAQVIVLGAGRIDAYTVAAGERVWWVRGLGSFPVGSPVLGPGVVIASTWGFDTPTGPTYDGLLKKFDANGDGRLSLEEGRAMWGAEFGVVDSNNDGFADRSEYDLLWNGAVGDYGLLAVRLGGRGDLREPVARDCPRTPRQAGTAGQDSGRPFWEAAEGLGDCT